MEDLALIIDLHRDAARQGPGGADQTRQAIALSGLGARTGLRIADIGCGTGASALLLAGDLDATVLAVDALQDFLDVLEPAAGRAGLQNRITPLCADMASLPFEPGALDAIWSEGAIYNIGFRNGIETWRKFLKPGGVLAVSELTWLTRDRPAELDAHWSREYPEVGTAAEKMAILEQSGFTPLGYFPLPPQCWLANYYDPMEARFPHFLARHGNSAAARALVAAETAEIALYRRHAAHVSYGFYIARRADG